MGLLPGRNPNKGILPPKPQKPGLLQAKDPNTGKVFEVRFDGTPPTPEQITSLFDSTATVSMEPPKEEVRPISGDPQGNAIWPAGTFELPDEPSGVMPTELDKSTQNPNFVAGPQGELLPGPRIPNQVDEIKKGLTPLAAGLMSGPLALPSTLQRSGAKIKRGLDKIIAPITESTTDDPIELARRLGVEELPTMGPLRRPGVGSGVLDILAGLGEGAVGVGMATTPIGLGISAGASLAHELPSDRHGNNLGQIVDFAMSPASKLELAQMLGVTDPESAENVNMLADIALPLGALAKGKGVRSMVEGPKRALQKEAARFKMAELHDALNQQVRSGKKAPQQAAMELRAAKQAFKEQFKDVPEGPTMGDDMMGVIMPNGEKIVQAAIRIGGRMFTGNSHAEAASKAQEAGVPDVHKALNSMGYDDGFVSDKGTYYTRDEVRKGTAEASPDGRGIVASEQLPANRELLKKILKQSFPDITDEEMKDYIPMRVVPAIPLEKINSVIKRMARGAEIPFFATSKKASLGAPGDTHLNSFKATSADLQQGALVGRIDEGGKIIALWSEPGDHSEQQVADRLWSLYETGKVNKDAIVVWADGSNMKLMDAIAGQSDEGPILQSALTPVPGKGGKKRKKKPTLAGIGSLAERGKKFQRGALSIIDEEKLWKHIDSHRDGFTLYPDGTPAIDGHAVAVGADKQVRLREDATPEEVQGAVKHLLDEHGSLFTSRSDLGIGGWKDKGFLYIEPVWVQPSRPDAGFVGRHTKQKSTADLTRIAQGDFGAETFDQLGGTDDAAEVLAHLPADLNQRLKVLEARLKREHAYLNVRKTNTRVPYGQGGREQTTGAPNLMEAIKRAEKYNHEVNGLPPIKAKAGYEPMFQRYHDLVLEPIKEALRREREEGKPSGKDWYTTDMQKFDDMLRADMPDITDAELKFVKAIGSPISAGTPVADEVRGAITAFKWFKATGKIPEFQPTGFNRETGEYTFKTNAKTGAPLGWSVYGKGVAQKFNLFNRLLKENGGDIQKVIDLLESTGTLKEMKAYAPSRETIHELGMPVRGAEGVLGDKIGPYTLDKTGAESGGLNKTTTQDTHMARSKLSAMGLGIVWDKGKGIYRPVSSTEITAKLRRDMIQFDIDLARAIKEETGIELQPKQIQAIDWGIQRDFAERNGEHVDQRGHNYPSSYENWKTEGGLDQLDRTIREATQGRGEDADPRAVQEGAGEGQSKTPPEVQGDSFEDGSGDTDFDPNTLTSTLFPGGEELARAAKKTVESGFKNLGGVPQMNISDIEKKKLADNAEALKRMYEKEFGEPLTDEQALKLAQDSEPLREFMDAGMKKQFVGQLTRLRQIVAQNATEGPTTPNHIQDQATLLAAKRFLGTALRSLGIEVDPRGRMSSEDASRMSMQNSVIQGLLDANMSIDEILAKSKDIDWNDAKAVAKFYRSIVKPTMKDLLDEYRYINMLSSPRTHIVNATSNMLQAVGLAPATKAVAYGPGAALAYYRGAAKAAPAAFKEAKDVFLGKRGIGRADVSHIPSMGYAPEGGVAKRAVGKALSTYNRLGAPVTRALEASDILFRRVIESGELEFIRQQDKKHGRTTDELDALQQAAEAAAYWIFRGELDPQNKKGQGHVLSAIDKATQVAYKIRKVPGGKYLLPFVATPMNIFKQGVEFSPAGFATMAGAKNKRIQFSKALIGSAVFGSTLAAMMNSESTWTEPTDPGQKDQWDREGKIPFAVKVNGTWVSYSKLGPIAYPMALAAAYKHFVDEGDDAASENILNALSGSVQFFADQSYVQGLQDLSNFLQGRIGAVSGVLRNVGRQMVPLTGFATWINGVADGTRRAPENLFESITTNLPGVSTQQSPRYNALGQEKKKPSPVANMFSPILVSDESENPIVRRMEKKGVKLGLPNRVVFGQKLSEGQYQRYLQAAGQAVNRRLAGFVNSSAFQTMSVGEAQREVNRIKEEAWDETAERMFPAAFQVWESSRGEE